jgi:hypothetical protein
VALIVLLGYAIVLGPDLVEGRAGQLPSVGSMWLHRGTSPRIDRVRPTDPVGYDGQFAYFIALDPVGARPYIDNAPYRYGRILYPIAAWALSFGRPGAVPYVLVALNVLAVLATVYLLAGFLQRHGCAAWWAVVYGFFPGLVLAVRRDLTEPLAFFLVACAILALERWPRHPLRSAPFFALGMLAREVVLGFLAVAAVAVALRNRAGRRLERSSIRDAVALVVLSVAPYLAYQLFLRAWLGTGFYEVHTSLVPLKGLTEPIGEVERMREVYLVVLPGLFWFALAVWVGIRHRLTLPLALVVLNVVLFVVWLPPASYFNYLASGRASTGLVLAAVLATPSLLSLRGAEAAATRVGLLLLTPIWLVAGIGLAALGS